MPAVLLGMGVIEKLGPEALGQPSSKEKSFKVGSAWLLCRGPLQKETAPGRSMWLCLSRTWYAF